jgi:cell division septum initiation protein DivIVA
MEKLQLKYDILQADTEKYVDMIAELKLAVKRKNAQIASLESETQHLKKMVEEVQAASRQKSDATESRMARLSIEVREKDERITQLRDLLVQQTEVMQLKNRHLNTEDERVSAV